MAEAIATLDIDGSGTLSLDEFIVWWENGLTLEALRDPDKAAARLRELRTEKLHHEHETEAGEVSLADERKTTTARQRTKLRKESILYGWDTDGETLKEKSSNYSKDRPGRQTFRGNSTRRDPSTSTDPAPPPAVLSEKAAPPVFRI